MPHLSARSRYWLTLILLIALSFLFLQKVADYSLVRIHITNSHSSYFKVYWTTDEASHWSESRARAVYVNSRKNFFVMPIPVSPSEIRKLRIDPNSRAGMTTALDSVSFFHLFTKPVHFTGKRHFETFTPNDHVQKLKMSSTLRFESASNDAYFVTDMPELVAQPVPALVIAQAVLLGLLLFGFGRYLPWLAQEFRWVPMGLLIASGAALAMASLSAINTHPDEAIHLANARYYSTHYAPAEVCAEEALYTYSDYGISRLNNREISYVVGGRFMQLVDFIPAPDHLKLRYLNVSLLFILALLAFRQPASRLVLLPVLLTPQAWYLFSYYNSDALSLFAVMLSAYQLFVPDSMLRQLLRGERPPGMLLAVIGLGLLVAMQYWVKLNYIFFTLYLGMLAVSWWLVNHRLPAWQQARPALLLLALGTLMFLSWNATRHAVNDFALKERAAACQEQTASASYKPSAPLEQTHPNVRLKDKGYTLHDIIVGKDWPKRLFYTALGTYGYMEYLNNDYLFEAQAVAIVLLLLLVFASLMIRGDAMARLAGLSALGAMAAVSLAALWVNWTMDFQPQGRYLMVWLPILGSVMTMYITLINRGVLNALSALAFVLGCYSFYAVGLVEVAKSL